MTKLSHIQLLTIPLALSIFLTFSCKRKEAIETEANTSNSESTPTYDSVKFYYTFVYQGYPLGSEISTTITTSDNNTRLFEGDITINNSLQEYYTINNSIVNQIGKYPITTNVNQDFTFEIFNHGAKMAEFVFNPTAQDVLQFNKDGIKYAVTMELF